MSRIIVKNLPKSVNVEKIRELFSTMGCLTDLQLKYTKKGVFRRFAFVGYKTEEEAENARKYFDETFVNTSKIKVEVCNSLGDENKPRAWSKHSQENIKRNNEKKAAKDQIIKQTKTEKQTKSKNDCEGIPEELQNDSLFQEFLELTEKKNSKPSWVDSAISMQNEDRNHSNKDDSNEEDKGDHDDKKSTSNLSDMEYLKKKMHATPEKDADKSKQKTKKPLDDKFTLKLKNLPPHCKQKQIKQFLKPLKYRSIRIPSNNSRLAFVQFETEKHMKQALIKHRGFLDGNRITITLCERRHSHTDAVEQNPEVSKEKNVEDIGDTGRLFLRNLCTEATEDDLKELFSKYGQLTEVHIPIDTYTKKNQRIAFVTYMFAEHAIKAFSELDGQIFQGRLLHIIPGKWKKETKSDKDISELSFKKRKEIKIRALGNSPHTWNTLFLGANAVVDTMSAKYDIKKKDLFKEGDNQSIAVRLALGETQIIMETREFLIKNGVQLDSFSQAAAARSKTTIIVKNLPAQTSSKELLDWFSPYGIVSKVVLPPAGLTALVEFQQAAEAMLAFRKLDFIKFGNNPLYFEWAPMDVFKADVKDSTNIERPDKAEAEAEAKAKDEVGPEQGSTLFVKNLNFTTTEESLRNHFKRYGKLHSICISKKRDFNSGNMLSMGFGFVHFKKRSSAVEALQELQMSILDGRSLEIKFSNREILETADVERKKAVFKKQDTTKILVRNIPFEVTEREIRELFKEFGLLKSVRLPKKSSGDGTHRGFGFVDFSTKANAKAAFNVLCHSTHLLGRRLVLEWANTNTDDVTELREKTARDFYTEGPKAKVKKSKLMEDVALASASSRNEY